MAGSRFPTPANEAARLLALDSYGILDTPPEPVFQHIAELAAQICQTPMAAVSLVDGRRQWSKSRIGLAAQEVPREIAFCAYTILDSQVFIVPDATADLRFRGNPQVCAGPKFRFYAGAPLVTEEGLALGAIEVFDVIPRHLEEAQQTALALLARVVTSELDQRRKITQNWESLQTLVEASPLAIYAVDPLGLVTLWNKSAEHMFGWTAAEVLGRPLPAVLPERESEFQWMLGRTQEGESFRMEIVRQKKDGSHIPVSVLTAPLRASSGQIVGGMAIADDLSERREADERLRQAQKMEAVGQLAGGVAHDFNNQLMVIRGYSELLLQQQADDPKAYGQLEKILRAADQAAALNNQLLAFSRRQILQPKVLDLNLILRDLAKTLGRMLDNDVILEIKPSARPALIRADLGQLQQVMFNLAMNARDAMPNGGRLTIAVSHEEVDQQGARGYGCSPGEYVCLTATDTGVGIDPAILPHIFEPFFTTKGVGKGTGLGLATVYGVVQQSGGAVHAESEITQGATFRVYLPSVISKPISGRLAAAHQLPRGTETIMLVEDERPLAIMEYEFLQGLGYTVLLAHDGRQAAQMVEELVKPVDLLVTDIVMPNMTGAELARGMRSRQPQLKVILVSGYTEHGPSARTAVPDDMDYIQKPYTLSVLVKKVREVLDGPSQRKAEPSDKTGT
jgi:PAS domain S-box-containing protein